MPITVTSVSPAGGHTGGKTLVEIDGTGFVVPATGAPVNGLVPVAAPTVGVWFGGVPALAVMVASSTLVYAVTPAQDPLPDEAGRPSLPRVVDVLVANVDGNGNPLAGESATVAQAYAYQQPNLTDQSQESDLARAVRTWVRLVEAQVTPNVSWPRNTDYDQDTGDFLSLTDLPAFPGLVISSVSLQSYEFAPRGRVELDNGDGTFTTKEPPDAVNILLTVVGVSDNPPELLNLAAAFRRFMRKNPRFVMLRDPARPQLGTVSYEHAWQLAPELQVTSAANASNLAHFAYAVSIVGFEIEDMPGLPLGGPGNDSRAHEATVSVTSEAESVEILPSLRR